MAAPQCAWTTFQANGRWYIFSEIMTKREPSTIRMFLGYPMDSRTRAYRLHAYSHTNDRLKHVFLFALKTNELDCELSHCGHGNYQVPHASFKNDTNAEKKTATKVEEQALALHQVIVELR